jgi:hypothetical protein
MPILAKRAYHPRAKGIGRVMLPLPPATNGIAAALPSPAMNVRRFIE